MRYQCYNMYSKKVREIKKKQETSSLGDFIHATSLCIFNRTYTNT